jgi:branched-chain amino acid transport system permease protein
MTIFLQLVASGVAVGMIYAAIAFGYQLTFATSKTLNFGQGEALALGALFGLTLAPFTGYWLMIPLVLVFGFALGAVVERLAVRPAIKIKSEYGWIMATIALGIIFRNLAENIWGRDDLKFPSPLPDAAVEMGGIRVLPMEMLIVAGALLMMLCVEIFNRKSIWGKAVVATSNDIDAAGLMGINTKRIITLSYSISAMTAAFAGVLVAPVTLTGATMGAVLALKAFAVAIIGGLESGLGVIVGGLIVLSIRPVGLFGKAVIKKV